MQSFLFECHFTNGDILQQTPEDKSIHTEGKNAFYDVLQRIDEVETFGLFSDDDDHTYVVHLPTGHFEIDGVPFSTQDPTLAELPEDAKRKLIFFKRHTHTITAGVETDHQIDYHLGWQALDSEGKNRQVTISVK